MDDSHMPLNLLLLIALSSPLLQEPHRGLRDNECGRDELLVGFLEGVSVYVRCESANASRVMQVTVKNDGSTGPLRSFAIGFCGLPVVDVSAPNGWHGEAAGADATVRWSIGSGTDVGALPRGERLSGFSVTLRPGWRMSFSMDIQWLDLAGAGTATTHDCM